MPSHSNPRRQQPPISACADRISPTVTEVAAIVGEIWSLCSPLAFRNEPYSKIASTRSNGLCPIKRRVEVMIANNPAIGRSLGDHAIDSLLALAG